MYRFLIILFACSSLAATDFSSIVKNQSTLEKIISGEEIQSRVQEIGHKITQDYADIEEISIVILMKGAICIAADLVRAIDHPVTLDFVKTKSYRGTHRGELTILGMEELNFAGKHVLVVDDVFDSGNTLHSVVKMIEKQQPKSLRSVVAFNKNVPRIIDYLPDYILFDIEDRYIVGYGMDCDQYLRNLPDVYAMP